MNLSERLVKFRISAMKHIVVDVEDDLFVVLGKSWFMIHSKGVHLGFSGDSPKHLNIVSSVECLPQQKSFFIWFQTWCLEHKGIVC